MVYILTTLAYILGSIPFGLIFSKLAGMGDIRKIGSGNIGATNVLRTGNKTIAITTLLCDFLKGFIPVACVAAKLAAIESSISGTYSPEYTNMLNVLLFSIAIASVIGHVFPVWLGFKGGKGVATALGVYFGLNPLLGTITVCTWVITTKLFKISSLSALIAFVLSPLYAFYLSQFMCGYLFKISFFFAILIVFTHRENIKRLMSGNESKVMPDK
ncbi:MAG: glycerol-3-phosphate 1-O-acyltransferase PlsY [Candidatus Paracaedibacteraceae bacterium]|nr:glycerol-3-phosphate 1-O-acyltransferase PlsY [Candidatus Paracaedibacteraceae bacterium]